MLLLVYYYLWNVKVVSSAILPLYPVIERAETHTPYMQIPLAFLISTREATSGVHTDSVNIWEIIYLSITWPVA